MGELYDDRAIEVADRDGYWKAMPGEMDPGRPADEVGPEHGGALEAEELEELKEQRREGALLGQDAWSLDKGSSDSDALALSAMRAIDKLSSFYGCEIEEARGARFVMRAMSPIDAERAVRLANKQHGVERASLLGPPGRATRIAVHVHPRLAHAEWVEVGAQEPGAPGALDAASLTELLARTPSADVEVRARFEDPEAAASIARAITERARSESSALGGPARQKNVFDYVRADVEPARGAKAKAGSADLVVRVFGAWAETSFRGRRLAKLGPEEAGELGRALRQALASRDALGARVFGAYRATPLFELGPEAMDRLAAHSARSGGQSPPEREPPSPGTSAPVDPIAALSRVRGVGPALALKIHEALGVSSAEELARAASEGALSALSGIGKAREASILEAALEATGLGDALELEALEEALVRLDRASRLALEAKKPVDREALASARQLASDRAAAVRADERIDPERAAIALAYLGQLSAPGDLTSPRDVRRAALDQLMGAPDAPVPAALRRALFAPGSGGQEAETKRTEAATRWAGGVLAGLLTHHVVEVDMATEAKAIGAEESIERALGGATRVVSRRVASRVTAHLATGALGALEREASLKSQEVGAAREARVLRAHPLSAAGPVAPAERLGAQAAAGELAAHALARRSMSASLSRAHERLERAEQAFGASIAEGAPGARELAERAALFLAERQSIAERAAEDAGVAAARAAREGVSASLSGLAPEDVDQAERAAAAISATLGGQAKALVAHHASLSLPLGPSARAHETWIAPGARAAIAEAGEHLARLDAKAHAAERQARRALGDVTTELDSLARDAAELAASGEGIGEGLREAIARHEQLAGAARAEHEGALGRKRSVLGAKELTQRAASALERAAADPMDALLAIDRLGEAAHLVAWATGVAPTWGEAARLAPSAEQVARLAMGEGPRRSGQNPAAHSVVKWASGEIARARKALEPLTGKDLTPIAEAPGFAEVAEALEAADARARSAASRPDETLAARELAGALLGAAEAIARLSSWTGLEVEEPKAGERPSKAHRAERARAMKASSGCATSALALKKAAASLASAAAKGGTGVDAALAALSDQRNALGSSLAHARAALLMSAHGAAAQDIERAERELEGTSFASGPARLTRAGGRLAPPIALTQRAEQGMALGHPTPLARDPAGAQARSAERSPQSFSLAPSGAPLGLTERRAHWVLGAEAPEGPSLGRSAGGRLVMSAPIQGAQDGGHERARRLVSEGLATQRTALGAPHPTVDLPIAERSPVLERGDIGRLAAWIGRAVERAGGSASISVRPGGHGQTKSDKRGQMAWALAAHRRVEELADIVGAAGRRAITAEPSRAKKQQGLERRIDVSPGPRRLKRRAAAFSAPRRPLEALEQASGPMPLAELADLLRREGVPLGQGDREAIARYVERLVPPGRASRALGSRDSLALLAGAGHPLAPHASAVTLSGPVAERALRDRGPELAQALGRWIERGGGVRLVGLSQEGSAAALAAIARGLGELGAHGERARRGALEVIGCDASGQATEALAHAIQAFAPSSLSLVALGADAALLSRALGAVPGDLERLDVSMNPEMGAHGARAIGLALGGRVRVASLDFSGSAPSRASARAALQAASRVGARRVRAAQGAREKGAPIEARGAERAAHIKALSDASDSMERLAEGLSRGQLTGGDTSAASRAMRRAARAAHEASVAGGAGGLEGALLDLERADDALGAGDLSHAASFARDAQLALEQACRALALEAHELTSRGRDLPLDLGPSAPFVELDVSGSALTTEDVLSAARASSRTLEHLDVSDTRADLSGWLSGGAKDLDPLVMHRLTALSACGLEPRVAERLADALAHNPSALALPRLERVAATERPGLGAVAPWERQHEVAPEALDMMHRVHPGLVDAGFTAQLGAAQAAPIALDVASRVIDRGHERGAVGEHLVPAERAPAVAEAAQAALEKSEAGETGPAHPSEDAEFRPRARTVGILTAERAASAHAQGAGPAPPMADELVVVRPAARQSAEAPALIVDLATTQLDPTRPPAAEPDGLGAHGADHVLDLGQVRVAVRIEGARATPISEMAGAGVRLVDAPRLKDLGVYCLLDERGQRAALIKRPSLADVAREAATARATAPRAKIGRAPRAVEDARGFEM